MHLRPDAGRTQRPGICCEVPAAAQPENRVSVYMEREVRDALQVIVKRIGGRELTTAGYIDNILREHLEAHKDRINEISRSHADIL